MFKQWCHKSSNYIRDSVRSDDIIVFIFIAPSPHPHTRTINPLASFPGRFSYTGWRYFRDNSTCLAIAKISGQAQAFHYNCSIPSTCSLNVTHPHIYPLSYCVPLDVVELEGGESKVTTLIGAASSIDNVCRINGPLLETRSMYI